MRSSSKVHKHVLRECPVCGAVYCEVCKKEWTSPVEEVTVQPDSGPTTEEVKQP